MSCYLIYNAINRRSGVDLIEQLLKEGENPNGSPLGCPLPLHRAVRFNRPDIAMLLLMANCEVTSSRRLEQLHSPVISIAARLNMTEVVLHLCTRPDCNMFTVDRQLQTIVHIAVLRRNYALLKGLLTNYRKDFDRFLTLRDGLGLTPLHLAASIGDLRSLKLLLLGEECCAKLQESQNPPRSGCGENFASSDSGLNNVCCKCKLETASEDSAAAKGGGERVGEQREGVRAVDHPVLGSKETMLHLAARGHHLEVVEFLLGCGAEVNAVNMVNNSPLHLLVLHGKADHRAIATARCLLNAGADWRLKGNEQARKKYLTHSHTRKITAGMMAAMRNKVAYLKLLAEFGEGFAEVSGGSMTPLMYALKHGSEEAARFLLDHDSCHSEALHTLVDDRGNTVLHHVSDCHSKGGELTEMLLDRGYGAVLKLPHLPTFKKSEVWTVVKFTPITKAILNRRLDVLQALVNHHPRCLLEDHYDHFQQSPLHITLSSMPHTQCVPFVDFLLAHGCNGNVVVSGLTAYQYVSRAPSVHQSAARVGGGEGGKESFSAAYLKKKLGVFFLEAGDCPGQGSSREGWSLRDRCLERVRQALRAAKGRYYEDVCSLPLPRPVIRNLLFES